MILHRKQREMSIGNFVNDIFMGILLIVYLFIIFVITMMMKRKKNETTNIFNCNFNDSEEIFVVISLIMRIPRKFKMNKISRFKWIVIRNISTIQIIITPITYISFLLSIIFFFLGSKRAIKIPININVTAILVPRMFEFKKKIKPILNISIPIILIIINVDCFKKILSKYVFDSPDKFFWFNEMVLKLFLYIIYLLEGFILK